MRAEQARQGARLGSIIDRRVLRQSMVSSIERGGELGGENGAAAIVKPARRDGAEIPPFNERRCAALVRAGSGGDLDGFREMGANRA